MNNSFKRSLYVLCFLLLSISAKSVMATCELPPASQYECKGRTLVTNDEELAAYLENYKYNSRHNIVRGVRLSGNFSGESLDVKTPCGIVVLAGTTFDYTGDICLAGRELVVGQANVNIQNAANVELISLNRVVIRENFSANMTGDLSLLSLGSSMDSRSHIRYEANISANNLILKSLRRSTIGHTSTFNLNGKLSILSNGEDLPTDEAEGISEWSSIWRDTTVNASEIEVISEDQARVANGVNLTANKVTLDGLTCKMGGTSSVTAAQKEGVCFDGSLPTIKLRRAAQYKEVLVGEDVFLDGSRSLYPEGSSFEWRIRRNKEDPTAWETGDLTRTFNFDQAGDYRIFFKITKPDGHYNFAVRRVWVSDPAPSIFPYFKFYLKDSELQLVYEGRTFDGPMITNAYYSTPQGETLDVGRMVLGHVDVIPFESNESLELTLNLENENGETASFTHTIEPNAANQEPYLPIDFLEYAPLETLFFSNFFFDPYDQLGELAGFALNFGDGESVELEQESFRQTHSYPSAGDYDLSLEVFNVEGESFSKAETITIAGVKDGLSSALPIVDFKIDKASWAPGVRLYIDESISPVSPISSYYWNLGDGQTAYGTEVLHFYDQGAYDVSLTVVTEDGNSNTITREVIVLNDAAMLYGSIDCWNIAPLQIECEVEGLSRDANLSEFLIHFGDSELTEENAEVESISGQLADGRFTHTFDTEGDYTVTFGVFTNDGEEFLSTFDVSVGEDQFNSAPIANIQCTQNNLFVDCDAFNSYDPDGYITSYEFSMGDGNSYTGNQVFHGYSSEGTYTVSLTVTDNLGRSSTTTMDINAEISGFHQPVAVLDCSSEGLVITCNGYNSFDPNDETLSYEFYYQDQLVSTDSSYQFTVPELGTYEIGLRVTNASGLSDEKIVEVDASENSDDLIFASLECNRPSMYDISCVGGATKGYELTYEWYIDGELMQENNDNVVFSFDELGTRNIKMIVSNEKFNKVLEKEIIQMNENPEASFSFSLEDNGLVTLDASSSFKEGLDIKKFIWVSNDGEIDFDTTLPIVKVKLSDVESKNLKLKIIDEIDREDEVLKYIDLSSDGLFPELKIVHTQANGAASRDVKLQFESKSALNLSDYSIQWSMENEVIGNQSTISHTFLSRGLKTISLKLEKGAFEKIYNYEFEIEEIDFESKILARYEFTDLVELKVKNLSNFKDLSNEVKINGTSLPLTYSQGFNILNIPVLPLDEDMAEATTFTYDLTLDGSQYSFSIDINQISFSESPTEDIGNHIQSIKAKLAIALSDEDFIPLEGKNSIMEVIDDYEQSIIDNSNGDIEQLKIFEYALRKMNKSFHIDEKNFNNSTTSIFRSILNRTISTMVSDVYAVDGAENIENAKQCYANLKSQNIARNLESYAATTENITKAINGFMLLFGGVAVGGSGLHSIGVTMIAAAVSSTANLFKSFFNLAKQGEYKKTMTTCLSVYFSEGGSAANGIKVSLDGNTIADTSLVSGEEYKIKSTISVSQYYFSSEGKDVRRNGKLYEELKSILDQATFNNSAKIIQLSIDASKHIEEWVEVFRSANPTQNWNIINLVTDSIALKLEALATENWIHYVDGIVKTDYDESTSIEYESNVEVKAIYSSSYQILSTNDSDEYSEFIATNLVDRDIEIPYLSYRFNSDILGSSGFSENNGVSYILSPSCKDQNVVPFAGGYIADGIRTSGNMSLVNSYICGDGQITAAASRDRLNDYGIPLSIEKSRITNPNIIGSVKNVIIQNSEINGSIIYDHLRVNRSTVNESTIQHANITDSVVNGSVFDYIEKEGVSSSSNKINIIVKNQSKILDDTRLVFDENYSDKEWRTYISGATTSRVKIRNSTISNRSSFADDPLIPNDSLVLSITPEALSDEYEYQIEESEISGIGVNIKGYPYISNSSIEGSGSGKINIYGETKITDGSWIFFKKDAGESSMDGVTIDKSTIHSLNYNLDESTSLNNSHVSGPPNKSTFFQGGKFLNSFITGYDISGGFLNVTDSYIYSPLNLGYNISGPTNIDNCRIEIHFSDLKKFTCRNSVMRGDIRVGKDVEILDTVDAPQENGIDGNVSISDGSILQRSAIKVYGSAQVIASGYWFNSSVYINPLDPDEIYRFTDLVNDSCTEHSCHSDNE